MCFLSANCIFEFVENKAKFEISLKANFLPSKEENSCYFLQHSVQISKNMIARQGNVIFQGALVEFSWTMTWSMMLIDDGWKPDSDETEEEESGTVVESGENTAA